jgi:hypothetical protein
MFFGFFLKEVEIASGRVEKIYMNWDSFKVGEKPTNQDGMRRMGNVI